MYHITDNEGQEYGPLTRETLVRWIIERRVNPHTPARLEGSESWKELAEFPEFVKFFPPAIPAAGVHSRAPAADSASLNQLPLVSMVLGALSMFLLGPLAGIPAIIVGHIANARIRLSGRPHHRQGMATAGLVMGYMSLVWVPLLAGLLVSAALRANSRAQEINCMAHMRQMHAGFQIWAVAHGGQLPFNLSTNAGGTLELASPGPDGVDPHGYFHLMALSNKLSTPKIFVCPADTKKAALNFARITPANVSYELVSGPEMTNGSPDFIFATCPRHRYALTKGGALNQWKAGPLPVQTAWLMPSAQLQSRGLYYMRNEAPPAERANAVVLFKVAAERGYLRSQYSLGVCYKNAIGVPTNNVLAWKWLLLAADHGSTNALDVLQRLQLRMSRAEVTEARKLAEQFRQQARVSHPETSVKPTRNVILNALKNFAYDGTEVTTLAEAERMLKHMAPFAEVHSFADDVKCGLLGTGYHVSIWINTFGKTNTYGIRYGTESDHSYLTRNDTYFEIVKHKMARPAGRS